MNRAVYIGNFDPVTLGHMDIIHRASGLVEEKLIVGIWDTPGKKFLLTLEERGRLLKAALAGFMNVEVQVCNIGPVYFAKVNQAQAIVRGVRNIADFEYECHMAQTNRELEPGIETIFFSADLKYSFLNSGTVRELAFYKKDISVFVPRPVADSFNKTVN